MKAVELKLEVVTNDLEVSKKEKSDAAAALAHITKLYDAAQATVLRWVEYICRNDLYFIDY